tara:strand:- start:1672 stop:1788 length:117 start_codon:yes stop_codon:yes gene_type:complete
MFIFVKKNDGTNRNNRRLKISAQGADSRISTDYLQVGE